MPVCFPEGLLLFCQLLGLREGGVHHGEQFNTAITKLLSNSPSKWQQPVLPVLSIYCAAGWGYAGRVCRLVASPGGDPVPVTPPWSTQTPSSFSSCSLHLRRK